MNVLEWADPREVNGSENPLAETTASVQAGVREEQGNQDVLGVDLRVLSTYALPATVCSRRA